MKNVEMDDQRMVNTTVGVCKDNADLLDSNPRITRTLADLAVLQARLKKAIRDQRRATIGKRASKAELLDNLLHEGLDVSSILMGYGKASNDLAILSIADVKKGQLEALTEPELADTCELLADAAELVLDKLHAYGMDSDDLDMFRGLYEDFRDAIGLSGSSTSARVGATASIPEILTEIKELFTDRLDKQVRRYRKSRPEFMHAYFHARKVRHYGVRHEHSPTEADGDGDPTASAMEDPDE